MKPCSRICLFALMFVCFCLGGCADAANRPVTDMKKKMDVEVGAVQKASVLSTDGQEVPLDVSVLLDELPTAGKELMLSDRSLRREDVRYTLILHRKVEAPLVLEVGADGSQFGGKTYGGSGAVSFYHWVRRLTGNALLRSEIHSMELSAGDMGRSLLLGDRDAEAIRKAIQGAQYLDATEAGKYPLYPHYQVKLQTANGLLTASVLTPTVISLPFGKETHTFRVDGSLFSALTRLIPPHEVGSDPFAGLFKASEISVLPIGKRSFSPVTVNVTKSIVEQSIAHQCIRLLKEGIHQSPPPRLPRQELYQIQFRVDGKNRVVNMYDRYFVFEGKVYAYAGGTQALLTLFGKK